jgi:hypothetical protein
MQPAYSCVRRTPFPTYAGQLEVYCVYFTNNFSWYINYSQKKNIHVHSTFIHKETMSIISCCRNNRHIESTGKLFHEDFRSHKFI